MNIQSNAELKQKSDSKEQNKEKSKAEVVSKTETKSKSEAKVEVKAKSEVKQSQQLQQKAKDGEILVQAFPINQGFQQMIQIPTEEQPDPMNSMNMQYPIQMITQLPVQQQQMFQQFPQQPFPPQFQPNLMQQIGPPLPQAPPQVQAVQMTTPDVPVTPPHQMSQEVVSNTIAAQTKNQTITQKDEVELPVEVPTTGMIDLGDDQPEDMNQAKVKETNHKDSEQIEIKIENAQKDKSINVAKASPTNITEIAQVSSKKDNTEKKEIVDQQLISQNIQDGDSSNGTQFIIGNVTTESKKLEKNDKVDKSDNKRRIGQSLAQTQSQSKFPVQFADPFNNQMAQVQMPPGPEPPMPFNNGFNQFPMQGPVPPMEEPPLGPNSFPQQNYPMGYNQMPPPPQQQQFMPPQGPPPPISMAVPMMTQGGPPFEQARGQVQQDVSQIKTIEQIPQAQVQMQNQTSPKAQVQVVAQSQSQIKTDESKTEKSQSTARLLETLEAKKEEKGNTAIKSQFDEIKSKQAELRGIKSETKIAKQKAEIAKLKAEKALLKSTLKAQTDSKGGEGKVELEELTSQEKTAFMQATEKVDLKEAPAADKKDLAEPAGGASSPGRISKILADLLKEIEACGKADKDKFEKEKTALDASAPKKKEEAKPAAKDAAPKKDEKPAADAVAADGMDSLKQFFSGKEGANRSQVFIKFITLLTEGSKTPAAPDAAAEKKKEAKAQMKSTKGDFVLSEKASALSGKREDHAQSDVQEVLNLSEQKKQTQKKHKKKSHKKMKKSHQQKSVEDLQESVNEMQSQTEQEAEQPVADEKQVEKEKEETREEQENEENSQIEAEGSQDEEKKAPRHHKKSEQKEVQEGDQNVEKKVLNEEGNDDNANLQTGHSKENQDGSKRGEIDL